MRIVKKQLKLQFSSLLNRTIKWVSDKAVVRTIFEFLVVLLIWFLFEDFWLAVFDEYILPYLSQIRTSLYSNVIFYLIVILAIGYIYKSYRKRYYIPLSGVLYGLLIIGIYCKYRIWGGYISMPNLFCELGYTDILIILLWFNVFVWLSAYFPHKNKPASTGIDCFIPDSPIEDIESDILDYTPVAKKLATDLEHMDFNGTCSVGLIAPWGCGKTSFLNLLCLQLSTDKFIVIKFNPRHSSDSSNIQKNFFDLLYSVLQEYDIRFSSSFKSYLKAIDVIDRDNVFSKIYDTHRAWNKENEKEKINSALNRIGRKVIIVIEDFDRLLSNEVIEIFKLIDGNASFSNLIFITAYDKQHINTLIGSAYSDQCSFFSDKFFTIEIQLPLRPYSKILNYLIDNLCKRLNATTEEQKEYARILNSNINILCQYLRTLRDVKRFLNMFTRQYRQIKEEVEFKDFFLLYLIKFKYPDEYDKLYIRTYIKSNMIIGRDRYVLNSENIDAKSKDILEILFEKHSLTSYRSINNESAFDIYFYESVYDGLEIKNMRKLLDAPSMGDVQEYISSLTENEVDALIGYLVTFNVLNFEKIDSFERYIDILIYLNSKIGQERRINRIFLDIIFKSAVSDIVTKYGYKDETSYKSFIIKKMIGQYPDYPTSEVRDIIVAVLNKEFDNDIILTHHEILGVAKSALRDLLQNDSIVDNRHLRMLYSCIESIDPNTRVITLDKDMCRELCDYIKKCPTQYFESFVRLGGASSHTDYNTVACEPFYAQIFGSANEFEKYIQTLDVADVPMADRVRNFWKLYKNNGYNTIEFNSQGCVQDKIDNDLKAEVEQLNQLLSLNEEFEKYEYARNNNLEKLPNDVYRQIYDDLLNKADNIHLSIKIKGELLKNIRNAISRL